jgi:hypothetical protein
MMKLVARPFVPRQPQAPYLWHLIRTNQLFKLKMFLKHGIWLARLDQFKDTLEGTLPLPNLGLLQMLMSPEMANDAVRLYEKDALRGYASCWHASDGDPSEEMWAQKFGNRGKAIAIRTSPALLSTAAKRFLGADGPCYLGEIRYIDHSVDNVPEANTLEVAFVVQDRFEYQNEVRFYLHILSSSAYAVLTTECLGPDLPIVRSAHPNEVLEYESEIIGNVPDELGQDLHDENDGKAIILPIPAGEFIDEILIGPQVSDREVEEVTMLLREAGLGERVRRLRIGA